MYLQFHYFDDCCLFFKRLLVVGVVLPWVSIASLLLSSVPSIRFINVFLSCFCLDYIRFGNILGTAYNFLVCYVSDTYLFWFTYGQFPLNHCSFFENSCMNLSSPAWHYLVHCSCRSIAIFSLKLLYIKFVISLLTYVIDSNCLSYLIFCNCHSASTFSFVKLCSISFSSAVSLPL